MESMTRKELKRQGRKALKRHYLLIVAACLVAALLSVEFQSSLSAVQAQNPAAAAEEASWQRWNINLGDVLDRLLPDIAEDNPVFGHTQGVLASLVNMLSSGSIFVTLAAAVGSVLGSANAGILLLILGGALLLFLFWFFLQNVYPVLLRRAILEGRTYERVPLQRFLYLMR